MDPWDLMKLFNLITIFPKYLTEFNYAGLNLNETPIEIEKYSQKFQTSWIKSAETIQLKNFLSYWELNL